MSEDEKNNWDKRYADDGCEEYRNPSSLLIDWLGGRLPGKVLDLACGTGRNAFYLAEKGYDVTAIDISPVAIERAEKMAREKGLNIHWVIADLDDYAIPGHYDLIIVNFFHLSKGMVPAIISALNSGGILLCENHMLSPEATDDEARIHRFHLKPGELRNLFKELKVLHYEERPVEGKEDGSSWLASLVAQKEGEAYQIGSRAEVS